MEWWKTLFDDHYLRLWGPLIPPETTQQQVDGIVDYLALEPGMSILDLGCGYGRVSIPLAQRGFAVTGLDLSETLLGQARAVAAEQGATVEWHRGDMRDVPWSAAFDAVISVYSSFGYFHEADNLRVLQGGARALRPGGRLLIDVVNRDWRARQELGRHWFEAGDLIVLGEPWLDVVSGRAGEVWRWLEDGEWQELEFDVRLYTATELHRLIETVGLRWVAVYGGWGGELFGPQTQRLIAVAER